MRWATLLTKLNNLVSAILSLIHLSSLHRLCLERMGHGDLRFCSFLALLRKTGSEREGKKAVLSVAFVGLAVSGMKKCL